LPERWDDPELQRLLIAEAKLGAAMTHRNLVAVSDLGVEDGRYYIVMEHVNGADVQRLLAGARPDEATALHVIDEVAAALQYVHEFRDEAGRLFGLVHRDVSPSNVLISRAGEVKLGDYGIAKATHLASETRARMVRGKYAYLSPEQVTGGTLTAHSDQFALATLLVELFTGRRPFDAPTPIATMEKIRTAADPDLDGLPADVLAVARRCLTAVPEQRFPDIATLRAALKVVRRAREPAESSEVARWLQAALTNEVASRRR
jgi:eukaryotic-like serine/threonine-protein kinase